MFASNCLLFLFQKKLFVVIVDLFGGIIEVASKANSLFQYGEIALGVNAKMCSIFEC